MLNNQLVRDCFGQYYKIHTSKDKRAPAFLKAERFSSKEQAVRIVNNLNVPIGFWKHILITSSLTYKPPVNSLQENNQIAELLISGRIKIYKINMPSYEYHSPEKRTVLDSHKNKHTFVSSSILLNTNPKEVLSFKNVREARQYLEEISPDKTKLKAITIGLDLPSVQLDMGMDALLDKVATSLASGETVIIVDRYSPPPRPQSASTQGEVVVDKKAGLGPPKDEEPTYDISTIIETEYKVVLFDRGLSKFQDSGEEPIFADPTYIELSLTSNGIPYDQGAKLSCSPANVDFFEDDKLTIPFDTNKAIPKEKIASGEIVKLYLKSKSKGKFTLKLTPEKSSDGRFNIVKIAEEELSCVELQFKLHQHDIAAIAAIQVDPDTDPVSDYHANLESKNLPDQIELSDENKVKSGRLLHVQKDKNFGRAKLLLKKPEADSFPADCENYEIVIDGKHVSGGLRIFDSEFDGNEVNLPLKIKKKDLTADKIYWVEGMSESSKLLDSRLDIGLDRSSGGLAKTPKRNADWARFSVVKFEEIKLDYTASTGKPDAWDRANKRFFINLKTGTDGRKITIKAKLGKPLKDIPVHFMLVEDKDNRTAANWGVDLPNDPLVHVWKWKDIDAAVKHLDKTDRKNLLHVSAKTDANGEASQEVILSQFGGDKFYLAAYIDQDPHFAKYIHGHTKLGERKPSMASDEINVWRKFWYQLVDVEGINIPALTGAVGQYERVNSKMEAASSITISRTEVDSFNPKAIYPEYMVKINGGNSDALVVSGSNKTQFFSSYSSEADKPVKIPVLVCDAQWDAGGMSSAIDIDDKATSFPLDITTNKLVINPPLQGGDLLATGDWLAAEWDRTANAGTGDWVNVRHGPLANTDSTVNPSRSYLNQVTLSVPSGVGKTTPDTHIWLSNIIIQGAKGPYLGESFNKRILAVYDSSTQLDRDDFQNTISHEIGHAFQQVVRGSPAGGINGIPAHPNQLDLGQGNHCRHLANKCVMYDEGPIVGSLNHFCDVCHPYLLVQDMTKIV